MDIFFHFYVFFLLQHEQKLHNLEGAEISDGDSKTGPRSALKALGKNNPAAIVASGEVASSSPVDGGKYNSYGLENKLF